MLPRLPDWTAALPEGSVLRAISSDGRYLITSVAETEFHVWDRAASMEEPMIAVPISFPHYVAGTLLAPDERTVAITLNHAEPENLSEVHRIDLATGKKTMTRTERFDHLLFSGDGNLLFIKDGVLRDLDNNREVRSLPKSIDGFAADGNIDEYALYRKEDGLQRAELRIYSWLTGQEQARATMPGFWMHVDALSRDGRMLHARGWAPGQSPWSASDYQVLIDLSADVVHMPHGRFRALSPDGQYLVSYAPSERPAWLKGWWPVKDGETTFRVTHWASGEVVAQFPNANDIAFAPQGTQLVLMRADGVVEGYAFPLRKPWGLLAGAALFAACAVWSVAWLWARRRFREEPHTK
jgi:hypothetical protein